MTTSIAIPRITHSPIEAPEAYAALLARFDTLAAGVDMGLVEIATEYRCGQLIQQYHFSGCTSTVYAVTCVEGEPVQQLLFESTPGGVIKLESMSLREHRVREALRTNPYCAQFGDKVPAMISASITDVRYRLALRALRTRCEAPMKLVTL